MSAFRSLIRLARACCWPARRTCSVSASSSSKANLARVTSSTSLLPRPTLVSVYHGPVTVGDGQIGPIREDDA